MRRSFWAFPIALALVLSLTACSNRGNNPDNGDNDNNANGSGTTGAGTTTGVGRTAAQNGGNGFNDSDYYATSDGEVVDFDYKYPNTTGRSAYNSLQQGMDDMTDGLRDAGRAVTNGVRGAGRVVADELVSQ